MSNAVTLVQAAPVPVLVVRRRTLKRHKPAV
jgi:hypothetical protein